MNKPLAKAANRQFENQDLFKQLQAAVSGELLFDPISRGQYATDASIYQVMPRGVLLPRDKRDIAAAISIARDTGCAIVPRGAGTSQNGQTVNNALVLDNTRFFGDLLELDVENRRCSVQPGMVLDTLNQLLKPHGLWFPVDVSTSSRATIGGMTGNNSCGQRSIVYGTMRHNVHSVDAILADGREYRFGVDANTPHSASAAADAAPRNAFDDSAFVDPLLSMGQRDAAEIQKRFPKVLRRVGGYNLDALIPQADQPINLGHLLVGSEGTLAYTTAVELKLAPIPKHRVVGVCHFPSFYQAMDAAQHLVALNPSAVELVDATMIALARDIEVFRPTVEQFVRGEPEALLLVEFARDSHDENLSALRQLSECMGDLGFHWNAEAHQRGGVIEAIEPALQSAIGEVRKSGLNIMMSMKSEGKPVSFVEDCAVELPHLAEYTRELTEVFERHGTRGTWYAHASVGCLHVRPVLNMKLDQDVSTMRLIADEAFDLVMKYKGSNSGEHGDGISRAEFYPKMFGERLLASFAELKNHFDANSLFNPGRMVNPPRMNDQRIMRFHPDYKTANSQQRLDWSAWPQAAHGFQGAVEMCNNNGACRKLSGGSMCPSYRVTRAEKHVTRGRANALRLALAGDFGDQALASDELYETLQLCVSCKACKRECPTGVDMARMKIEVLSARAAAGKLTLHDRLVAWLPRYAPVLSKLPQLANLRNRLSKKGGKTASWLESLTGFSASRMLPAFRADAIGAKDHDQLTREHSTSNQQSQDLQKVILWADTFNRYFEPENVRAAIKVLKAAGYTPVLAKTAKSSARPLCCGRTFLSAGLIDQAKSEMQRTLDALLPEIEAGAVVVGLEPSCLFTLRDELQAVIPGDAARKVANNSYLFEEFLQRESERGCLELNLKSLGTDLLLHGHCHQKAFNVMGAVEATLRLIPDAKLQTIESSCCGMAGSFGLHRDTVAVSKEMAEAALLPAIRAADEKTVLVADGISCRHQISDGAGRTPLHVARVLEMALA